MRAAFSAVAVSNCYNTSVGSAALQGRLKGVFSREQGLMNKKAAATFVSALVLLSGVWTACLAAKAGAGENWPLFRGNALSTGVATSELPDDLTVLWRFRVKDGAFEGSPVVVDGVVYIGDLDGGLYALDLNTGAKKWEHRAAETGFIASPAVRGGRVFIGDYDGRFYCLNAADGKPLWGFESEAQIDSGANFYQDNVLFGSQDGTLYCLNAKSGKLTWKYQIDDQIRCTPTVVEERCFVAGCDGRLHIIDLSKGESLHDVEIDSPTGVTPAVQGDYVFFGTEAGEFFSVNWKQAKVAWKWSDPRARQALRSSPAVTREWAIFGGRDKKVHALDAKTGEEKWSFSTRKRLESSPVIVGGRVFIGGTDGRLYALNRDNGQKIWSYEAGGGFIGSPAVSAGRLIIANDEGVVFCFGEKK